MFVCPFAVQVWQMTGLAQEINAAVLTAISAADVIFQLLRTLSFELKQRLVTVFWSLRKHRNLRIWENKIESCAIVVDRARVLLEDWLSANITGMHQHAFSHDEQPL